MEQKIFSLIMTTKPLKKIFMQCHRRHRHR